MPLFASFSLRPCGGGRKEGIKPVLPSKAKAHETTPEGSETGTKVAQEMRGNRGIRGFLSISLVPLRLEDSWHWGLGCEATWQDGFLVAGCVKALCWLSVPAALYVFGHGTALLPDVESHILTQFLSRCQILQLPHLLWLSAAGETAVLCHTCRHAGTVRGTTGRASLQGLPKPASHGIVFSKAI